MICGAGENCAITICDADGNWPVPLVELRTTGELRFVSDNAGRIAIDAPELFGREVWFHVHGHGYSVPTDGFGYRGVRLKIQPGGQHTIRVQRDNIAQRLGRLTGAGLFAESQKLGLAADGTSEPVAATPLPQPRASVDSITGCDSVQLAVYRDRLFWAWGDTLFHRYPLGLFETLGATTDRRPIKTFEPPLFVDFDYFRDREPPLSAEPARLAELPRNIARLPGKGPTWLSAFFSVRDETGRERLCATYSKIEPPLTAYEVGLCEWSDEAQAFQVARTLWNAASKAPKPTLYPDGHPARWTDPAGVEWLLFGNPLPRLRCPATYTAWKDPSTWEALAPVGQLCDPEGHAVKLHSGSIAWNQHRQRWVTVFLQAFGKPSAFGELWYAEAAAPTGPWGPAIKILTHENYTFYNPRIQSELLRGDESFLVFEGTYTQEFANRPFPTPRYNYNQILYRLELNDPRLQPAQQQQLQRRD